MGKIVAVWSSAPKTGKTVFLYTLVHHLANGLRENLKVLVCCANVKEGNLMELFNVNDKELNLEDMVNLKISSGGDLRIFEAMAKRNNLYFAGSKKTSTMYAARNITAYEELFRDFKGQFDLILVDTLAGKDNILTNMVLQKSDFVLNVLCQDKEVLDAHPFDTNKDMAYIVNRYREIYPGTKELAALYSLNSPLFKLPLCDQLQEMKNRGKLALYMQHDTEFNHRIQEIANFMIDRMGLKKESDKAASNKKRGLLKHIVANVLGEAYE